MIDIATRCREIIEVGVRSKFLGRQHVDGAHERPITVIGKERSGRQRCGINEELAHSGEELGQLDELAHSLKARRRWGGGDFLRRLVCNHRGGCDEQYSGGARGEFHR
jgi:hypothetical protein